MDAELLRLARKRILRLFSVLCSLLSALCSLLSALYSLPAFLKVLKAFNDLKKLSPPISAAINL